MEEEYPKFDSSNLSEEQKEILSDFFMKRKLFDNYIQEKGVDLFTCPGCSYPTLLEKGLYEICSVCSWQDDGQGDIEADEIWGGANLDLSLTENRLLIGNRLQEIAKKVNGKIIHNPLTILFMLHWNKDQVRKKLGHFDEKIRTQHLVFTQYLETKDLLLGQLIMIDNNQQ